MSRRKLTFAVTFLLVSAALLGMAASAQAGTVLRGTDQLALGHKGTTDTTAKVDFLATRLHAQLLRVDLRWNRLVKALESSAGFSSTTRYMIWSPCLRLGLPRHAASTTRPTWTSSPRPSTPPRATA